MELTFLGAAGTVTGSRYLLDTGDHRILVDCGLFQGLKALRLKNWDSFPVDPQKIDAIFLTHAHLDHSGYIPKLVADGFRGTIYCSAATYQLCRILLLDSAKLMEEEARHANGRGYSKHKPALSLYTAVDVEQALKQFSPIEFHREYEMFGLRVSFKRAGHILGASSIRISGKNKSITFSGDVGRPWDPIVVAPELLEPTDFLVVESTYGDRKHPEGNQEAELAAAINLAEKQHGLLLIPSFAVGRAQEMIHAISKLKDQKKIPDVAIYMDSPMASAVSELYGHFPEEHRLTEREYRHMYHDVRVVKSVEESIALSERGGSRVVISASGMATGGRVLIYMKENIDKDSTIVLFAGYQAAGTRGASLVSGAKEVKIHGEYVKVSAKVMNLDSFSAHADYEEILTWIDKSDIHPEKIFITHGEPAASDALRRRLGERFKVNCEIPTMGQTIQLDL